jgi:hypothetical protein
MNVLAGSKCLRPLLIAALAYLVLLGCKKDSGNFLSLEIPILKFVQAQGTGELGARIYDFPTLLAYNDSGRLVYFSHNAGQNAALLQSLPQALDHLPAIPNSPELATSLQRLPSLSDQDRRRLLRSNYPVVLAFTLEGCDACAVQENALNPAGARMLARRGVNVVLIRVLR